MLLKSKLLKLKLGKGIQITFIVHTHSHKFVSFSVVALHMKCDIQTSSVTEH